MANGQEVTPERIALYCRALSDIGETQLIYAFEQALRFLGDYLPSLRELRAYAQGWRPSDVVEDSSRILDRGDKPADWEPLQDGELERMKAEFRQKLDEAKRESNGPASTRD